MAALLWFTAVGLAKPAVTDVSATLVDAGDHNVPVATPPAGSPQAAAPGSFVAIKVTATLTTEQEEWRSTSYAFGSGSATCVDTADHATGEHVHGVRGRHASRDDAHAGLGDGAALRRERLLGTLLASAESTFTIRTRTTNQVLAPHCDTRVALVLDESGSIGSTTGAQQAVIDGSKAFVNGLVDSGAQLAVLDVQLERAHRLARHVRPGVYNNVTSEFASGPFANYITGEYNPSGWTNWEDAFDEVSDLTLETRAGRVPDRRRPDCAEPRA